MRTLLQFTRWIPHTALLSILALGLWITGCATGTNRVRTLNEVQTNVSWAMQGFRDGGIGGMYTTNQRDQVNSAYAAYQRTFTQALNAAGGQLSAPAPESVTQAADQLAEILDSL